MGRFLTIWLINLAALLVVLHTVSGVSTNSWQTTLVAALVLALLNMFIRPILLVLTLPVNILSLGIFTLFVNAFVFYIAAKFVKGFAVMGFWNAFLGALIFSIISSLLGMMVKKE